MKLSPGKKKTFKFWLFFAVASVFVICIVSYQYLRSSMPVMSGNIEISGLSAPVEVIRDTYGIPHITAANNRDAFKALGFVMASERLFQMEVQRRLASGQLSEVFGDKALASDKLFRNLGLREQAEKLVQRKSKDRSFDPEMLVQIEAFYEGVNEFIATQKMPIEFTLLSIKPTPFSIVDAYTFVGLMGFNFGVATMLEPTLSSLVTRIGGDLVEDLRNEKIPAIKTRTVQALPEHFNPERIVSILSDLENGFPLFEGSNGWILGKHRSASGFPILANDPHINFSHPGVWFEAHVKTPDYETYGHFLPVLPFPVLSHNRERAWGFTMSLIDDMDIYRETINTIGKTYLFKGENLPLEERIETINIKGKNPEVMTVFKTHHGPILDNIVEEKSLSLQWTFYNPANDPVTSLYKMGTAKNIVEFKAAVSSGISPGLNVLYADKDNIGWWIFGEVWKKRPDLKGDFILDGTSGQDEISGYLSFKEKPFAENPASGIIISANSRPENFPKELRGDWQADDRYKTLEAILAKKDKWSAEEVMEVQTLNINFENKILLETLLSETIFTNPVEKKKYQEFFEILKEWDLSSEKESIAPSIYYSWCKEIQALLFKDLTLKEREIMAKTPNGWIFFKRVLNDQESLWWKKFERAETFKLGLINAIENLTARFGSEPTEWKWGHMHTLEYVHPLGRVKPLNYLFNLGPYEMAGSFNEVNNQKYTALGSDFHITAGPSTRRVIDFSHIEKSWGILPQGNSGHLLSPFYSDQVSLFANAKYREQWLDLKNESAAVRFKMTFIPKK
jgi:penicillin amidase